MLTTKEIYKTWIQVTGNGLDTFYELLIKQVDDFIKQQCHQWLESQVITAEYLEGRNRNFIITKQRPVQSIQNLWYDPEGRYGQLSGSFDPVASLQISGVDYIIKQDANDRDTDRFGYISRSGIIHLLAGQGISRRERRIGYLNTLNRPTHGTFKLAYTSGFAKIPEDLTLCANMIVRALQNVIPQGGLTLTAEADKFYSYNIGKIVNRELQIANLLAKYRGLGASIY